MALAKVFRRHRPKVVLGFGGKTVLASPDHYQAMLITDAAVFYSRLTKWDEHFDGLPVHTITNQLSFPIALHGLDLPEASGLHRRRHRPDPGGEARGDPLPTQTQFPASKAGIFGAVETMNRYHGLTAGFEAGELFLTYRSVGVDDLMRWASPAHARTVTRTASRTDGRIRCVSMVRESIVDSETAGRSSDDRISPAPRRLEARIASRPALTAPGPGDTRRRSR